MTGKMMNCGGVPVFIANDVTIKTPEFYVSYNDRDVIVYGDVTTALVLIEKENPVKFLILNGNHIKAYNEIIAKGGGYADCLAYFKSNVDKQSKYSENWDEKTVVEEDGSMHVVKDI